LADHNHHGIFHAGLEVIAANKKPSTTQAGKEMPCVLVFQVMRLSNASESKTARIC
jgi:hypothetical protein